MKVLMLTQVLPYPPDSGPKIKTWNVIKYIAENHDITLVSFVRGDQSANVDHLRQYCSTIYTVPMERGWRHDIPALFQSLIDKQPWIIVRDERQAMQDLINQLNTQTHFDIVHADQLNMAQYAIRVHGSKRVFDAHNALWLLYKRLANTMNFGFQKWLFERDWRLLRGYEGKICTEFDAVLAVSQEDQIALTDAALKPAKVMIIPIAVDTKELPLIQRGSDANHILYIGTMYWPPNIDGVFWFIREVWPFLRAKKPDLIFDIVGSRPPKKLQKLGGPETGINVTGYVKDTTPYLTKAGVMVVPLRAGGGMRVKILEALANGLPIVSTTLGCEGIALENNQHIMIADDPVEFAQKTLELLDNRSLADKLGHNGRTLIETNYDYRVACRPLDSIYAKDYND